MQLVYIVLHKVELLDTLLGRLHDEGLGATFCDSKGMEQELVEHNEHHFLGSLHRLLNPARKESKVIFTVELVAEIARDVTGGLNKPETGVLFAVPVTYAEGFEH